MTLPYFYCCKRKFSDSAVFIHLPQISIIYSKIYKNMH